MVGISVEQIDHSSDLFCLQDFACLATFLAERGGRRGRRKSSGSSFEGPGVWKSIQLIAGDCGFSDRWGLLIVAEEIFDAPPGVYNFSEAVESVIVHSVSMNFEPSSELVRGNRRLLLFLERMVVEPKITSLLGNNVFVTGFVLTNEWTNYSDLIKMDVLSWI